MSADGKALLSANASEGIVLTKFGVAYKRGTDVYENVIQILKPRVGIMQFPQHIRRGKKS